MEITPDNFWKTYDSYLKDGANYVANLKLSKMVKDLGVDKDIPPRLRQWSQDHLNLARGAYDPGSLVKAVESGADNFLKALSGGQLASGSARQGVLTSGKMFLTQALLFWQHPFLAGQILQSTGFMSYALANWKYNLGYGKGSAVESMLKGSMNLMFDPKKYKSTIDYLGYRGKLDPSLVAEIGWKSDTGLGKAWEVVSGGYIAKGAEALGRIHAAAVGHEFMSAQGLKGKDLHMAVERFVDDVMGNYGMTDRPGYITRTGVVGEALKPLSTFKNYFLGATAVALKEGLTGIKAGNPKKMIPFINLWMGTAVLGGLTGALGYAELDWAYNKLKGYRWFQKGMEEAFGVKINENSPSLTEAILTSDIGDTASLGIVTGASKLFDEKGIYLSGSMTAPEVTPSIVTHGVLSGLAPGVGYATDAVGGLTKIILDQLDFSPMTVEERRKANKQLAPGIIDKILSNIDGNLRVEDTISRMFSEDKDLFIRDRPTPEGARGHGGYDRRTNYDIYASIAGGGTIPEYREKVARRDLKETEAAAAAQKTRLIDMGVDDLMFGDGSRIGELATKALELGFDDYTDQIMDQLMKKYLTNKQAEAMKEPNLRTIRRQQYLDEASQ